MQLFVLAALTLTTSLLRVPHGARTMPRRQPAPPPPWPAPRPTTTTLRNDDWMTETATGCATEHG